MHRITPIHPAWTPAGVIAVGFWRLEKMRAQGPGPPGLQCAHLQAGVTGSYKDGPSL